LISVNEQTWPSWIESPTYSGVALACLDEAPFRLLIWSEKSEHSVF